MSGETGAALAALLLVVAFAWFAIGVLWAQEQESDSDSTDIPRTADTSKLPNQ